MAKQGILGEYEVQMNGMYSTETAESPAQARYKFFCNKDLGEFYDYKDLLNHIKVKKIRSVGKMGIKIKPLYPENVIVGMKVNYYSFYNEETGQKSEPFSTTITSDVWRLGHGAAVCNVNGISGCVALSHLEKIEPNEN